MLYQKSIPMTPSMKTDAEADFNDDETEDGDTLDDGENDAVETAVQQADRCPGRMPA